MRYIKEQNHNTMPLDLTYTLWPFNDENQDLDDFISGCVFSTYEEAEEAALELLRNPRFAVAQYDECLCETDELDKLVKLLEDNNGFHISQMLVELDDNFTVVDCPIEYLKDVGCVYICNCEECQKESVGE